MYKKLSPLFWPTSLLLLVLAGQQAHQWLPLTLPAGVAESGARFWASLVWLTGGWVATVTINRLLVDFWIRRRHRQVAPALIRSLVFVVVFLFVSSGILSLVFHKEITGLWAMSGGVGLIIGIALQGLLANFFAGITINAEGAFKVGEYVQINNTRLAPKLLTGKVVDINWHSTRIKTSEGNLILMPNNLFNTTIISNLSVLGLERALEISLYFDSQEPLERLTRILEAAALSTREILRLPSPKALVGDINERGQEVLIEAWFVQGKVREKDARSALMTSIHQHLRQAGIAVAKPAQELWLTRLAREKKDLLGQRIELLGQVDLFGGLSENDRAVMAVNLKERQYAKGELIFAQGDPAKSMFVVMEGLIRVKVEIEGQGRRVEIAELTPGSYVGEMSLFTGAPRSADVEAVSSAILYEITQETLSYLLEKNPSLSRRLFHEIAVRQAQMLKKKDKSQAQHEREQQQLTRTTFHKIKRYFQEITGGLFLVEPSSEPRLTPDNAAHMGLLMAKIGNIDQRDLARSAVILGIGTPRPPKKEQV